MRPTAKHLGLAATLLLALATASGQAARRDDGKRTDPAPSAAAPSGSATADATSTIPDGDPAMQQAVDRLARSIEQLGGTVGVHIIEVGTGRVLAAHQDRAPLNPASNMKVVTAACALWHLAPEYRITTALYGEQDGEEVEDLVLRSQGDPTLDTGDLWELAGAVGRSGIRRVRGDVLVDQTFFDDQFVPPGFEQQPDEWAYFRAPVSAVALELNTVTMHVMPRGEGGSALVSFFPDGFVDIVGRVRTGPAGSAQDVTLVMEPNGTRLRARVGGSIPEDSRRLRFTRRVEDPRLFAGHALKRLLVEQGIEVRGDVRPGAAGKRERLALHVSAPLHEWLARLGKESDNFAAEMLLKSMGGDQKRNGLRTEDGASVVLRYLTEAAAHDDGIVIRNGSGLFDTNRLTAHALTSVLRDMHSRPALRHEFVSHLAVAGVDGTLRWRLRGPRTRRVVRAKTGTLGSVTALSGYVLTSDDDSPVAFSILVNGVAGKVQGARAAVDRCVETVAQRVQQTR